MKDKAKGRQQFVHEGRLIYEWDQTIDEVNVYIQPPDFLLPKNKEKVCAQLQPGQQMPVLEVNVTARQISVGIKGNPPFLKEELGGLAKASETLWSIVDDELQICIQKVHKAETWECACKGHQSLDPLLKTEVQKNILLERFQEENPGFDFSSAEVNGMVPDPKEFMGGVKYN